MIKVVKKTQIRHTPSGDCYMILYTNNGLVYPVKIPIDIVESLDYDKSSKENAYEHGRLEFV